MVGKYKVITLCGSTLQGPVSRDAALHRDRDQTRQRGLWDHTAEYDFNDRILETAVDLFEVLSVLNAEDSV